jgi:hypothetical protein
VIPRRAIVAGAFAADIGVLPVKHLVGQAAEDVTLEQDFGATVAKESVAGGFYGQDSPELCSADFGQVQGIFQTFVVKGCAMAPEFIAHDGLLRNSKRGGYRLSVGAPGL